MISKRIDVVKSFYSFRSCKILFLHSCTAMVLILILCYTCMQTVNRSMIPQQLTEIRQRKLVLLWTTYFTERDWLSSAKELNCPVQCDVTSNRSLIANSSAVIMHWRNLNPEDLPECTEENEIASKPCPVLVLFNKEAPPHTPGQLLGKLNDKIHWTATYRRDSEIYAPYGKIAKRTDTFKLPELNTSRSLVCWLVSNCHTPSNREVYVDILKHYVDVEVYGKCGNKSCPHKQSLECYRWLSERCKFYLSFENSFCKDYVTEKLYYAMMTNMVPVVLGGDDYTRHLPAHSFIDVADYSSPKALAEYLKKLDEDDFSYLSYLHWKKDYIVSFTPFGWFCDLCERLHNTKVHNLKPYKDTRSWWFDEAKCRSLL